MDSCSKHVYANIVTDDEKSGFFVDTNIISLSFKEEEENKKNIELTSPIYCEKCQSIASCFSIFYEIDEYKVLFSQKSENVEEEKGEISKSQDIFDEKKKIPFNQLEPGNRIWICDFCAKHNKIVDNKAALPKEKDFLYIKNVPVDEEKLEMRFKGTGQDQSIIFCIDNSGSMGGTNLKCVKQAIKAQLKDIHEKYPNKKVGIVTFESNVEIFGDGTNAPLKLPYKLFEDFEGCINFSSEKSETHFQNPISKTLNSLEDTLAEIESAGSTALGPGLLSSIGLVIKSKSPGSLIVLCTDGMANEGLGKMDRKQGCDEFYKKVGNLAKENGIIINVLTIKGGECRVDKLSMLSDFTGGMVSRIKPTHLMKDFNKALEKEMIGTNAKYKINLHRALCFKNENESFILKSEEIEIKNCIYSKDLGNITKTTEVTFEFGFKSKKDLAKLGLKPEDIKEIPFQAQIEYYDIEDRNVLRVMNLKLLVSKNFEEVKKGANIKIVAMRASHDVALEADEGNLLLAKRKMRKWQHFMEDDLKAANTNNEEFCKLYEVAKNKNDDFAKQLNKKLARKIKKKDQEIINGFEKMNFDSCDEIKKNIEANSSSGSSDECEAKIKKFKRKRQNSFVFDSCDESMSDHSGKKNAQNVGSSDGDSDSDSDIKINKNLLKHPKAKNLMRFDSGDYMINNDSDEGKQQISDLKKDSSSSDEEIPIKKTKKNQKISNSSSSSSGESIPIKKTQKNKKIDISSSSGESNPIKKTQNNKKVDISDSDDSIKANKLKKNDFEKTKMENKIPPLKDKANESESD